MDNRILLGSIALEPNRWTTEKVPYNALVDLLPQITNVGFSGIEIWQFHVDRLSNSELDELSMVASQLGVGFPSMAVYPDLQASSEDNAIVFSDLVTRCSALGVARIKTFSGTRASDSLSEPERSHAMDQLRLLIDIAAEKNIVVSAELHQNSLTDSVSATLSTLGRIDRPLTICYQPIDFANNESTLDDFRRLHESIDHVHLQGRRSGEFSLLEDADISYPDFFQLAKELQYTGDYCIEFVRGCVVDNPDDFSTTDVLDAARKDRKFVVACLGTRAT